MHTRECGLNCLGHTSESPKGLDNTDFGTHPQSWAGARELAFLTNPQMLRMLRVFRRHFKNHYAKLRKAQECFEFWLLDHMERQKERPLPGQER